MARVAISMKLYQVTFDTNGKLREARTLHSITFIVLSFARNCILNGPVILSSRIMRFEIRLILRIVSI